MQRLYHTHCRSHPASLGGGDVRILAEFPDRAPVILSDLSENDRPRKSSRR
jgi:hypothetical protein